jgi:hypothetical protein
MDTHEAASDGKARPLALVVTPGQRHDSTQLAAVLELREVGRQLPRHAHDRQPHALAG